MRGLRLAVSAMALGGLLTASLPAFAQNVHISRLYEQVLENIEYADPGHVLDSFGVIRMNEGGTVRVDLDVPGDVSVQVMGDCDGDCYDLDLVVYDDAGDVLGADRLDDDFPIVNFTSAADGRITLELDLIECDAAYCYAAYSVFIGGF